MLSLFRERVEMLVEKRRRAVDREYREQMERKELGLNVEVMLGTMNSFTSNMVSESRRARERSINRVRDLSRSLSRSSANRTRDLSAHKVTSGYTQYLNFTIIFRVLLIL